MKRFAKKLAASLQTDSILRNWDNLTLWIGSGAFLISLLFFSFPPEIKFSIWLLVGFFNFLAFRFVKLESDIKKEVSAFVRESVHTVETADLRHFYLHMKAALTSADHRADVTRLEETKPADLFLDECRDYYETANKVIRKRLITFRRIVRITTPAVLEWTTELLEQLGDCPNFNIRSLPDCPAVLSVQIFDGKEVMLDQPESIGPGTARYMLRIRGKRLAEAFSEYYGNLWNASTPIKEGGTIHWEKLIEIAEGLLTEATKGSDQRALRRINASLEKLNKLSGADTPIDGQ